MQETTERKERAVLAGLAAASMDARERSTEISMQELAALVDTAGGEVLATVLQNKATDEQLDSFFDGALEPFAIQLSEALTMAMFSERERAQGTKIVANANRLQYMSVTQKVQMAKELGDRGAILIDEIRELFNYAPLPDGAGQVAPIRGEYKATDELSEGGEIDANEDE